MAKKALVTVTTILLALFILAAPALAVKNFGEISEGIAEQGQAVGATLVVVAAVAGLFFIMIGFISIRKASRQGGGTSGLGWASVFIGALLCCIVVFSQSTSKSIFGEEDAISSHIEEFQ